MLVCVFFCTNLQRMYQRAVADKWFHLIESYRWLLDSFGSFKTKSITRRLNSGYVTQPMGPHAGVRGQFVLIELF